MILRNGLVVDGSESCVPAVADLLVRDGEVTVLPAASTIEVAEAIDCTGCAVCPGFIDIHTHSDLTRLAYPDAASRTQQGITTEVIGNCGMTAAPVPEGGEKDLRRTIGPVDLCPSLEFTWSSFAEYLDVVDQAPSAVNTVALIGHGSVRHAAIGNADRAATRHERRTIVEGVADAMRAGAWGVSFGLMYSPGDSADAEELLEVAGTARAHGGLVAAHVRAYDDGLLDAVDELISVGGDGRVQVSHLRSIGPKGHGVVLRALERLHEARGDGVDVSADAYPYTAGHTTALQLLSPGLRAEGPARLARRLEDDDTTIHDDLEGCPFPPSDIIVVRTGERPTEACGHTLAALAEADGRDWRETLIGLLREHRGAVDVIVEGSYDDDVARTLWDPLVSIASDGAALAADHDCNYPHPRSYGTFPRAIRRLLDDGMQLAQAVARATSRPADRLGLAGRGRIFDGAVADLVVLDPDTLDDRATYRDPRAAPRGVRHVLVGGELVVRDGRPTGARPGRLLRAGT